MKRDTCRAFLRILLYNEVYKNNEVNMKRALKNKKEILLPKVEKFSANIRARLTAHFDTVFQDMYPESVTKDLPDGTTIELHFDSNVTEYETEPNLTLEFTKNGETVVIASNCVEVDYDKIVDTLSTTDYALITDNLSPLARKLHDSVFESITSRNGLLYTLADLQDTKLTEMMRDVSHNSFAPLETDDKNGMTIGYLVREESGVDEYVKEYVRDVMDETGVDGLILVADDKVQGLFTPFDDVLPTGIESLATPLPSMSERINILKILKETVNQLGVLHEQNSEREFAKALSVLDNDDLHL